MTTARLLSGRPENRDLGDGQQELTADLRVDLGVWVPKLWEWVAAPLPTTALVNVFEIRHDDGPRTTGLVIHKGFIHNGSSYPDGIPVIGWLARLLVGAKEKRLVGGIVHDALYRWQAPRDVADEVWWRIARSGERHLGPARGWFGWAGLRLGGWWAYWRNRA